MADGTRMSMRRALALVVVVAAFLALPGGVTAARASQSGFSFSRSGAISYANYYESRRNSVFPSYSDNCTNYVSQVWHLGAKVPLDGFSPYWYYQGSNSNGTYSNTHSWSVSTDFRDYWYRNQNVVDYIYYYGVTNTYNPALPGDAIIYSRGDDGKDRPNFHHAAIEHNYDGTWDWEIQNTKDELVHWNLWYYHSTATEKKYQRYWGYRIIEPKVTNEGY